MLVSEVGTFNFCKEVVARNSFSVSSTGEIVRMSRTKCSLGISFVSTENAPSMTYRVSSPKRRVQAAAGLPRACRGLAAGLGSGFLRCNCRRKSRSVILAT